MPSKSKPRKLTEAERELHIWIADDEEEFHVSSESPRWTAYFTRLFGDPGRPFGDHGGARWDIPKGEMAIRKRVKRVLTDEQKQVARDRLMRLREAK